MSKTLSELPVPGLVSIIIPAYNAEKYLQECLESVLAQTYAPIEVIVVDDGSKDRTAEVAARFAEKIVFLSQENSGVSAARNHGLLHSRGEFIAFFDADDFMYPDAIERRMQAIREAPEADIIYSDVMVVDEKRTPLSRSGASFAAGDPLLTLLKSPALAIQSTLIRRRCFARAGLFNTRITHYEDWDFFLRCAPFRFKYCPEITADYRQHGSNATRLLDTMLDSGIAMLQRYRPADAEAKAAWKVGLFGIYRNWVWRVWASTDNSVRKLARIARMSLRRPQVAFVFAWAIGNSVQKHKGRRAVLNRRKIR